MNLLKQKRIWLLGLLLVSLIGLLAAFRPAATAVSETAVTDTAVPAAPMSRPAAQSGGVVSAEGTIVPLFFTNLSFQTGGVISDVLAVEGDSVAAGDPLVRLAAADQEIALQQAQARLSAAQAGLQAAQNQLALAQAGITTAQANVTVAAANLALTQAGPLPEEVTAAQSQLAVAEAGITQAAGTRDATLNNIGTDAQIQSAEANLAAATADLRALEEQYQQILDACYTLPDGSEVCPLYGATEETVRAQLEVAQANQLAAQEAVNRLRSGPTSAQQQAANAGVSVAVANRNVAQAQLDLVQAGASDEQIAVAEVGVAQAEVGVSLAEVDVAQAEASVAQAEAAVTAAEAAVEAAQAALDRMTLFAPFDGTVARIDATVGELVAPSAPQLVLADFSGWLVETTDLTELDVALVTEGAPATVRIDAIPEAEVQGTVSQVSLVSDLSRGDVVYEVTLRLDAAPDLPLRWGMTVFVDVETP